MSNLRDPFAVVHKKEIKNKNGDVVARVDYVGWSQVADRLDEAAPGWSFEVIQLGEDWCWGRLIIDGRKFENVGYAENAEMAWKKEPLKDAVSDALKRCAALAGVARYLYDKDGPHPSQTAPAPRSTPDRPITPPVPVEAVAGDACPVHGVPWLLRPAGISKNGTPYDAFYSCGVAGPPYCKEKPGKSWVESNHP